MKSCSFQKYQELAPFQKYLEVTLFQIQQEVAQFQKHQQDARFQKYPEVAHLGNYPKENIRKITSGPIKIIYFLETIIFKTQNYGGAI